MKEPKIIGFISSHKEIAKTLSINKRNMRRVLMRYVAKKYFHSENIYISGLEIGPELDFAEIVNFLFLDFYAVLSTPDEEEEYARSERIKFKKIVMNAKNVYSAFNLPGYKIKKKQFLRLEEKVNYRYAIERRFLNAKKFVVDNSDIIIVAWNGARSRSNIYKALRYVEEGGKEADVIHVGNKYL